MPVKKYILKVALYAAAMLISSLGISILALGSLGMAAMNTCFLAAANLFEIELGKIFTFFNGAFLLIGFCFAGKKYMGIGSVLTILLLGPSVDMWTSFFMRMPALFETGPLKILVIAVGYAAAQFGMALSTGMRLGCAGFEACLFELADRISVEYKYLKIISEVIFFAAALAMGGAFGVLTLVEIFISPVVFSFILIRMNAGLFKKLGISDIRNELYRNNRKYKKCEGLKPPHEDR